MNKISGLISLCMVFTLAACGGKKDEGPAGEQKAPATRGVTADSIHIGCHGDLSGPVAAWGVGTANGMRMRFDEANEAGGIHGRKIKLFVEDNHYQVPAAVKAANKLINVNDVFLMVGSTGTPMNNAVLPAQLKAGVPNLFPLTAAVQMYEPLHPMKFSYFVSYRDQIRAGMAHFAQTMDKPKTCLQTVASDYGDEVDIGFKKGAEENGLDIVYEGRHKATESDFTGTVTSIKNSGCELLVLGPIIKDAIILYTAARAAGWDGTVVSNMVPYTTEVAKAADGGMEGFYTVSPIELADMQAEIKAGSWIGKWAEKYSKRFGVEPNAQAEAGYLFAELTIKALQDAGPELTTDKVLAALEKIEKFEDPFGGSTISFSPTKHQGGDFINLYQVSGGKWKRVKAGLPY